MNAKQQLQRVELQRQIKRAIEALRCVQRTLELEQEQAAISPDNLADRIRDASRAAATRGKA